MGVICSPVSVACVSMVALIAGHPMANGTEVGLVELCSLTIPAGLIGLLVMATYSNFRGKDLDKDPQFQALIADPEAKRYVYGDSMTLLGKKLPSRQWTAMWIFLAVVLVVALLGAFSELRPMVGKKPLHDSGYSDVHALRRRSHLHDHKDSSEVRRRYLCVPFRYGCCGLRVRRCMALRYDLQGSPQ